MDPTPDHPAAPAGAQDPSPSPRRDEEAAPADGPDTDACDARSPVAGTGEDPATAMRTGTAPRAVLRPVPEGFPTPPPRPARPTRRPGPPPPPELPRRRGPLIAALATVAVLVLAVGVGGGILVVRALSPDAPAPAVSGPADPSAAGPTPDGAAATDDAATEGSPTGETGPGGAGQVVMGPVSVHELSTELGIRTVGAPPTEIEPEGEFVIVTLEVANGSGPALILSEWAALETADGQVFTAHKEATTAHLAESRAYGVVPAETTATAHVVFDVPFGAEPVAAHLDLSSGAAAGTGTLPLGG